MTAREITTARPVLMVTALWLGSLCAAPIAHAVAISSCGGRPFAFKDAEVNVIILPYFQAGPSPRELNGLGSQLALLVKLETLYRAMAYDRWGIVLLAGPKEECDPDRIAHDLLLMDIHPGGRLIVVWGKLYQQDEDVYVQTFARFYRRPLPGEKASQTGFAMRIADKKFQGRVSEEFGFPPEQLPIQTIQDIAESFSKAVFLYDAPDLNSKKTPLPLDEFRRCDHCAGAMAFTVEDQKEGWVRVRRKTGEPGYLLARIPEGITLGQRMPEVMFLQGVIGFLRYAGQGGLQPSQAIKPAEQALLEYVQRNESIQEPETKAAALQLNGILEFLRGEKNPAERFDDAYELVPYSADARNLAAMFRVYRDYNLPGKKLHPREVVNDFVAAAALDPENSMVLENLENFYELLTLPTVQQRTDPVFAIKPAQVHSELERVKSIRQNLAKSNPTP
jgi:hypothetical protein